MTQSTSTPALRSRAWFDNPANIDMTALYLERYLNFGLSLDELRSGRPIIGIAQTGSDLSPCNRHHLVLAERVRDRFGRVDGLIHLVGGWRGGGGLAGQSDEDYRALEVGLTALRHASRAFDADLRASDAGRLAIVSSTAIERPLAAGANYATVKAASEAWTRAVAQGFGKAANQAYRRRANNQKPIDDAYGGLGRFTHQLDRERVLSRGVFEDQWRESRVIG